jgi:hypothetical protein
LANAHLVIAHLVTAQPKQLRTEFPVQAYLESGSLEPTPHQKGELPSRTVLLLLLLLLILLLLLLLLRCEELQLPLPPSVLPFRPLGSL